jgi:hypothetical protein
LHGARGGSVVSAGFTFTLEREFPDARQPDRQRDAD